MNMNSVIFLTRRISCGVYLYIFRGREERRKGIRNKTKFSKAETSVHYPFLWRLRPVIERKHLCTCDHSLEHCYPLSGSLCPQWSQTHFPLWGPSFLLWSHQNSSFDFSVPLQGLSDAVLESIEHALLDTNKENHFFSNDRTFAKHSFFQSRVS